MQKVNIFRDIGLWIFGVGSMLIYGLVILWLVTGDMEPISYRPIHPVLDSPHRGLEFTEKGRIPSAEEIEAVRIRAINVIDSLRATGLY